MNLDLRCVTQGHLLISDSQLEQVDPASTAVQLSLTVDEGWEPPRGSDRWNQGTRSFKEVQL